MTLGTITFEASNLTSVAAVLLLIEKSAKYDLTADRCALVPQSCTVNI